jgi:Na+-transporting NADH:ubiquinone oxidoreductase subunit NqrB
MNLFKDKKNLVILLLVSLFIIKIPQEEIRFIFWILGGVFLCAFFDYLISNILLGKKIFPNSAIISGFIVSGILDYRQSWFVLFIFSILPVLSKHIIKFRNRHIFNPANFSLFFATLFKIPLVWSLESNVFLIIAFGIYLAFSYRKIPHILGFLTLFLISFAIAGVNALGIISWFFIFIMLIEPKTSGYGNLRGFIFGAIAGFSSFLFFRFLPYYDPFILSLFIANLCNPLLDKKFK